MLGEMDEQVILGNFVDEIYTRTFFPFSNSMAVSKAADYLSDTTPHIPPADLDIL